MPSFSVAAPAQNTTSSTPAASTLSARTIFTLTRGSGTTYRILGAFGTLAKAKENAQAMNGGVPVDFATVYRPRTGRGQTVRPSGTRLKGRGVHFMFNITKLRVR